MLIDFPIKVPYTTAPSMGKLVGDAFNYPPSPTIQELKRLELEQYGGDLHAITHEARVNQLVLKASRYCNVKETNDIVELAMNFEEDFAIMHRGVLSAICFCFPSSWIPSQRIGLSLTEIHSHVADNDRLVAASNRIAEMMASIENGSFRRYVWTICNSKELSQHPANKSEVVPMSIKDLYFRTEVQTTVPLGDNVSSLFFVKVNTYLLEEIWNTDMKQTIIDSINSMSDNVLDYKNLRHIKSLII